MLKIYRNDLNLLKINIYKYIFYISKYILIVTLKLFIKYIYIYINKISTFHFKAGRGESARVGLR